MKLVRPAPALVSRPRSRNQSPHSASLKLTDSLVSPKFLLTRTNQRTSRATSAIAPFKAADPARLFGSTAGFRRAPSKLPLVSPLFASN